MEKLGLHTRPVPPRSTAARARAACSRQPVVPTTVFTPSAASRSMFSMAAAGMENSMATSMPRKRSRVMPAAVGVVFDIEAQRHGEAVLGRKLLDQASHFSVADNREIHGWATVACRAC